MAIQQEALVDQQEATSPHVYISLPVQASVSSMPACSTATKYVNNGCGPSTGVGPQAELAAHGHRTNKVMLGLVWSLTSLVFGIMASIVGPTASILARRLDVEESALGPVFGVNGITTLLAGMPSGWLLDHVPGNKLLALALLIEAGGYVVMPLCSSVLQLTVAYGVVGFLFNVLNTGINVMVIWQFKNPRELALVLNLISAMFGLGGMLAPQVVNFAMLVSSGELAYPITACLCLIMCTWVVFLASPISPKRHRAAAGKDAVRNEMLHAALNPAAQAAVVRPARPWSVLGPAMLVVFCNISIELGYAAWIYMFAKSVAHVDEFAAESLTSTYWLAFTAMRTSAVGLAACITASHILLLSMPLAIFGALWPLLYPGPTSTLVSVICVGIGAAAGFPNTLSLAAEHAELDGTLNGVISTVAGLSMTIMPAVVPFLAHADPARGFQWLMIITLFFAVGQLLFLVFMLMAGSRLEKNHIRRISEAGQSENQDLYTPFLLPAEGN